MHNYEPRNTMTIEQVRKKQFLQSLKDQIELKRQRINMEKIRNLQEDQRILKEQEEYQYYGRCGAGSVRKDQFGNVLVSKRPDPNLACNLYGRQAYNETFNTPHYDLNNDEDMNALKCHSTLRLQNEYERQLELKRQIEAERMKRKIMEDRLEEEQLKKENEKLKELYIKERDDIKKKLELLRRSIIGPGRNGLNKSDFGNQTTSDKIHVKLQANLEKNNGSITKQKFINKLNYNVKKHFTNIVNKELRKVAADMKHEENIITSSIMLLRVWQF